ncbi:MAG: FtsX-like permease family protein, partial [Candidatus Micrarchaeia archaeon]
KQIVTLIIIAIVIGILKVSISSEMIKGFKTFFTEDIIEIFAGDIIITPPEGTTFFENYYQLEEKLERYNEVRKVIPQLEMVGSLQESAKGAFSAALRTEFHVIAIDKKKEEDELIARKIYSGNFLTGKSGEILLGYNLADDLDLDVDDTISVDFYGKTYKFKIVGIVKTGVNLIDRMYAAINYEDAQKIYGRRDVFNRIYLKLYDKEKANDLKYKLLSDGIRGKVATWKETVSFGEEALNILSIILFLISAVAILAASFGVAIMLYINVLHKTKIIGTIRALGGQKSLILRTYVFEAVIIGIVGVLIGSAISFFSINYLSQNPLRIDSLRLRFSFDYGALLGADFVVLLCVFLASLYPAYKASSIEPVEAMRYE